MPELLIIQGAAGSGKTTLARQMCDDNIIRVNRDDIRYMLYGTYHGAPIDENVVTKIEHSIIEAAFKAGKSVISDNTNVDAIVVKKLQYLAFVHGASTSFHKMDTDLQTCLARNRNRDRVVPDNVIVRQFMKLENFKLALDFPVIKPREWNNELPSLIMFDIDGTLAHAYTRSPYDFSRVSEDIIDDWVFGFNIAVGDCRNPAHIKGSKVFIMSGREDSCRQATIDWLNSYGVHYDDLLMRRAGDKRPDALVKYELYNEHIRNKYNLMLVVDDRKAVVRMWSSLGVDVWQVDEGDF